MLPIVGSFYRLVAIIVLLLQLYFYCSCTSTAIAPKEHRDCNADESNAVVLALSVIDWHVQFDTAIRVRVGIFILIKHGRVTHTTMPKREMYDFRVDVAIVDITYIRIRCCYRWCGNCINRVYEPTSR